MSNWRTETYRLWPDSFPGEIEEFWQTPMFETFLCDCEEPRGSVIVLPGGGYEALMDYEGATVAQWFQEHGLNAFVLNYRVKPYTYPACLLDVQRMIRHLRHNPNGFNINDKIAVMGFSAGGHLAALAGTRYDGGDPDAEDAIERQSSRPDAIVGCYGLYNVVANDDCMENLLGPRDQQTDAIRQEVSCDLHVDKDTSPAFLWGTGEDDCIDPDQPIRFAKAMVEHGLNCELHLFAKGPHGLDLGRGEPSIGIWPFLCLNWLQDLGF